MLAGLVKNPTGYDPTNAPDRSLARRNVVLDRMAQLSVIRDKKAEKTKELGLGLHLDADPQRLRVLHRAVLLRLRRQLPDEGPAARQDARRAQEVPLLRRADDPDHHRPRQAGGRRRVGRARTSSPATGHRRAGDGRAPHRQRQVPRPVAPDGSGQGAGQTYLNYVVPEKYGDSQRLPGRLDVQGVRARRRHRAGHPALRRRSAPRSTSPSRRATSRTATACRTATAPGRSPTRRPRAPRTCTPAPASR